MAYIRAFNDIGTQFSEIGGMVANARSPYYVLQHIIDNSHSSEMASTNSILFIYLSSLRNFLKLYVSAPL